MKTRPMTQTALFALCGLMITSGVVSAQNLIDLRFDSSNPDNVAGHPSVSSVTSWTNGSEVTGFLGTNPTPDFGSGYAGLTVPHGLFGYRWGFEGGFALGGTDSFEVSSIMFDYHVRGHNGEGTLTLGVGSWTGAAPLPSTDSLYHDIFDDPGASSPAQGTVTFDFANDLLTVSRLGIASYTAPLTTSLNVGPGSYGIDIITANNRFPVGGGWDVNVNSAQGGNDGYYRIDNFVIAVTPVPEPSGALILGLTGTLALLRRRRSATSASL